MSTDPVGGDLRTIEGQLVVPDDAAFAIVASRFNNFVVERLIEGALDALVRHGAKPASLLLLRVPGSWELPLACRRVARSGKVDAIVALSALIRGGTPHFEYIAAEVSKGSAAVALETGVPVTFGVLTTDTLEQAVDRAGVKSGNKVFDAALAAIEMVSLNRALSLAGY